MRFVPGEGQTRLHIRPLGTIAADTHWGATRVELALVEADIEALVRSATSAVGRADLAEAVQQDLRTLAVKASIQFCAGVCLLAAATSALLLGRHLHVVLTAVSAALITVVAMALLIVGTFDTVAFSQPTFSGPLVKAEQVIEVVAQGQEALDETRSRFDVASERLSDLFVLLGRPDTDPRQAQTVLLHVSDIHANPIGFEITRQLADEFGVDAIVDTGDLASAELDTGEISSAIDPVDSAIAQEIRKARVPYVYVPGNHDSPQLRRKVASIPNALLLDRDVTTVDTLTILGFADPTFSTEPVLEAEKRGQRLALAPEVADVVAAHEPDVLAVHDPVLSSEAWGMVPTVVAGHTHEKAEVREDGTLVLTVGSTGATGLKHLTVEAGRRYEAEILYFEGDDLVAVDYVSLADIGGDFELSRRTYAGEDSSFTSHS